MLIDFGIFSKIKKLLFIAAIISSQIEIPDYLESYVKVNVIMNGIDNHYYDHSKKSVFVGIVS
jgi:hypothetical protein